VLSASPLLSSPTRVGPSTPGRCPSASEVVGSIASLSELHALFTAPTTTDAFRNKRKEWLTQPYRGAAQERFPWLSVLRPAGESATTMTSPTNFYGG